jgi:hypothetical protein
MEHTDPVEPAYFMFAVVILFVVIVIVDAFKRK